MILLMLSEEALDRLARRMTDHMWH